MQPAARREEFEQPPGEQGSLAWLESLAADQDDSIFNLDLSSLPEEQPPEPAPAATDPVSWLEDLARNQGEMPTTQTPVAPRAIEGDSLTWLESLARRQGAKPEELTTAADLDIPAPAEPVEAPAYTPFSFDTPTTHRTPPPAEPLKLDDPAAFLGSLASEQGYSEQGVLATQPPEAKPEPAPTAEQDLSIEGIQQAINEGTVTPEQMQVFLDHETDFALQLPDEPFFDDYDPDAPPVPAELPDWLLEQVGPPPAAEPKPEQARAQDTELEKIITQSSALDDMPDWLRADITSPEDVELESIFAQTDDRTEPELPVPAMVTQPAAPVELEIDPNDPWVEAFDIEHEQGEADIEAVPEWYQRNVSDPARIAAVERLTHEQEEAPEPAAEAEAAQAVAAAPASANGLSDEALPEETLLPAGTPQALPEWMPEFAPAEAEAPQAEAEAAPQAAEEAFAPTDMPDWLREVESAVSPEEIPDWLKETLAPEEEPVNVFTETDFVEQPPAPESFTVAQPEPEQPRPAPRPAPVAASLETARATRQSGDVETSLAQYESLVRNSIDLDAVVEDLSHMVRVHKNNPAVYRVLGDGLMRQGKLQAALDTYREALNQL